MSLHEGIDTVSWVSLGLFTKTNEPWGSPDQQHINNSFVSLGLVTSSNVVGAWKRFINIMGWPWKKTWKKWG